MSSTNLLFILYTKDDYEFRGPIVGNFIFILAFVDCYLSKRNDVWSHIEKIDSCEPNTHKFTKFAYARISSFFICNAIQWKNNVRTLYSHFSKIATWRNWNQLDWFLGFSLFGLAFEKKCDFNDNGKEKDKLKDIFFMIDFFPLKRSLFSYSFSFILTFAIIFTNNKRSLLDGPSLRWREHKIIRLLVFFFRNQKNWKRISFFFRTEDWLWIKLKTTFSEL